MAEVIVLQRAPRSDRIQVFFCRPYWLDRGKLGEARRREFRTEREAKAAGRALAQRYARVEVYSCVGYPLGNFWEEPSLIALYESLGDALVSPWKVAS